MRTTILNALIWLDIKIFHLITLGNTRPGETMSAAAWHLESQGKWQGRVCRPLINALFSPWQRHHCQQAWAWQRHLYN